MNNEMKINTCLSARIFTSSTIFPVLLALAFVSSVASAQEPQDPQEPKIYYLKKIKSRVIIGNRMDFGMRRMDLGL